MAVWPAHQGPSDAAGEESEFDRGSGSEAGLAEVEARVLLFFSWSAELWSWGSLCAPSAVSGSAFGRVVSGCDEASAGFFRAVFLVAWCSAAAFQTRRGDC